MDELGKSFPAAEGMVEAETGLKKKPVNEFCLNCGTKLQDVFCHHCGQKDIPARQTLGELWTNFISSFWSYEGKFFQTTKYIVTKPGFLAMEYNQGKRESYYHPARMYVFISFVFFLLFVSLPGSDDRLVKTSEKNSKTDSLKIANTQTGSEFYIQENLDSVLQNIPIDSADRAEIDSAKVQLSRKKLGKKNLGFSISKTDYETTAQYDSAELAKPEAERDGWFSRAVMYKMIDVNQRYKGDWNKFGQDFKKAFNENFSKVLFWLLPFFALVLKLLYIRHDYFYSEHLVFSIYNYNFFFLAGSLQMMVELAPWLDWLVILIDFWIFFYLLFAMKRMYLQSWGKTIVKFCLFIFLFSTLMGIGFLISVFSILFTI